MLKALVSLKRHKKKIEKSLCFAIRSMSSHLQLLDAMYHVRCFVFHMVQCKDFSPPPQNRQQLMLCFSIWRFRVFFFSLLLSKINSPKSSFAANEQLQSRVVPQAAHLTIWECLKMSSEKCLKSMRCRVITKCDTCS